MTLGWKSRPKPGAQKHRLESVQAIKSPHRRAAEITQWERHLLQSLKT